MSLWSARSEPHVLQRHAAQRDERERARAVQDDRHHDHLHVPAGLPGQHRGPRHVPILHVQRQHAGLRQLLLRYWHLRPYVCCSAPLSRMLLASIANGSNTRHLWWTRAFVCSDPRLLRGHCTDAGKHAARHAQHGGVQHHDAYVQCGLRNERADQSLLPMHAGQRQRHRRRVGRHRLPVHRWAIKRWNAFNV